jgi:hypothetical protein
MVARVRPLACPEDRYERERRRLAVRMPKASETGEHEFCLVECVVRLLEGISDTDT